MANGIEFGNKEQHMIPLNDIVVQNKKKMQDALLKMVQGGNYTAS